MRGTQFLEPLFEFSGACVGCGETPYLKLVSQLFGDRLTIANATGCSSIYGGNLPTTPWTVDADGHGPAWSNSLFEDNAEFGLGLRLAADSHTELARRRLSELRDAGRRGAGRRDPRGAAAARVRAARPARTGVELERRLDELDEAVVAELRSVVDHLIRRSVWIVGGDGWAYDIGSGGLDHVLASGHNVNVLVLDTEIYSTRAGRCRRRRRSARWEVRVRRQDDAHQGSRAPGDLICQRLRGPGRDGRRPPADAHRIPRGEAYDGPSLLIAYSHCIGQGIDMRHGLDQQYKAVASGHWPLIRYDPVLRAANGNPFLLDRRGPGCR